MNFNDFFTAPNNNQPPRSNYIDIQQHYQQRPNSRHYRNPDNESYYQSSPPPPPPPPKIRNEYRFKPRQPYVEIPASHPIMIMISESTRRRRMPPPYHISRGYRSVRRQPTMRAYIYGFRTSEDDDWKRIPLFSMCEMYAMHKYLLKIEPKRLW